MQLLQRFLEIVVSGIGQEGWTGTIHKTGVEMSKLHEPF